MPWDQEALGADSATLNQAASDLYTGVRLFISGKVNDLDLTAGQKDTVKARLGDRLTDARTALDALQAQWDANA